MSYFSANDEKFFARPKKIEERFLTLDRALVLLAFINDFANKWFDDTAKGRARRDEFNERMEFDYSNDFGMESLYIEPIVYKLGSYGAAIEQRLLNGLPL